MPDPCFAPTFRARNTWECFLRSLVLIPAIIGMFLLAWIPAVHCLLVRALFELRMCHRGNQDQSLDLNFDPNSWLAEHQLVGSTVVWQETTGALRPHSIWTALEKRNLYDAFWKARTDEVTGVPEAPADATPEAAGRSEPGTWYPRSSAWRAFIAHVGQTLAVENARWVPWSLTSFSHDQLAMLLDSRSLFAVETATGRYGIDSRVHGTVTPGDPVRTFRFLRTLAPTAVTSEETIARLLDWCRANLQHFLNALTLENCLNHWGFSGYPPVERMISGTTREHPADRGHFTAGCHGTVGFIRAVLRVANIPVARVEACRHAQPHFVREDLFLSHGDDPYSRGAFTSPLPAANEMLIDRATHDSWFGPSVSSEQQCANVGRRMAELTLRNPNSDYILRVRCRDVAARRSNAESEIYAYFREVRSLAELEALGLWSRLDDEIARRGGCDRIPG